METLKGGRRGSKQVHRIARNAAGSLHSKAETDKPRTLGHVGQKQRRYTRRENIEGGKVTSKNKQEVLDVPSLLLPEVLEIGGP
jgi:hypothetical protein